MFHGLSHTLHCSAAALRIFAWKMYDPMTETDFQASTGLKPLGPTETELGRSHNAGEISLKLVMIVSEVSAFRCGAVASFALNLNLFPVDILYSPKAQVRQPTCTANG
jgi:hypothetical protein